MFLEEFQTPHAVYKLRKILETLNKLHGVTLNLRESTIEELEAVLEEQVLVRHRLVQECAFNQYFGNEEYTRTVLICEALRIYLKEIAPHRKVRRKTGRAS